MQNILVALKPYKYGWAVQSVDWGGGGYQLELEPQELSDLPMEEKTSKMTPMAPMAP